VGTRQLLMLVEKRMDASRAGPSDIDALLDQSITMAKTSLCPLGQSPVLPIRSAVRYFPAEL
jgi:NADH:ubiquinone oxidoreductase subunit F (NADH-binding)